MLESILHLRQTGPIRATHSTKVTLLVFSWQNLRTPETAARKPRSASVGTVAQLKRKNKSKKETA